MSDDESEGPYEEVSYPWHRSRISSGVSSVQRDEDDVDSSTESTRRRQTGSKMFQELSRSTTASADSIISQLRKSHDAQEKGLEALIQNGRFHTIEHFLEMEFERQQLDLSWKSTALFQDGEDGNKKNWYQQAIQKYEGFFTKVGVIRAAFLRTFEFYRQVTEATVARLQEKQGRELLLTKAMHTMSSKNASTTKQHLDLAQMREKHSLEVANVRELSDKTSAREIHLLEFHLKCTEELMLEDIAMCKALAQQKADHIRTKEQMLKLHRDQSVIKSNAAKTIQSQKLLSMQVDFDKEARKIANEARTKESKQRKDAYTVDGKSVANDALYKLTFRQQDVEYTSDSLADTDDESDTETSVFRQSTNVAIRLMYKQQRKENAARRKTEKADLESALSSLQSKNLIERKALRSTLRQSIDQLYAQQKSRHFQHTTQWTAQRKALAEKHDSAMRQLQQKHILDQHVLLEADKQLSMSTLQKSSAAAQRSMSAHVFHELRNVLSSMLAIADSLEGSEPIELIELADRQRTICTYATEVMADMLDIVRYQGGVYKLVEAPVNLRDLAQKVADIQGDRVGAAVELHCISDDIMVLIDRHIVLQLLVNLLSNSSKFTSEGRITIIAKVVEIVGTDVIVELGVCDTGCGMNEQQEHPTFATANEYMARSCGYGLVLSRLIATTLSAQLTTLSPVPFDHQYREVKDGGRGTFTSLRVSCTTAPIRRSSAIATFSSEYRFNPQGVFTVLIADDQSLVRTCILFLLRKVAEKYDCEFLITTVQSGEEAQRMTETRDFDLLFIDMYYDQRSVTAVSNTCDMANTPELRLSKSTQGTASADIRNFMRNELFSKGEGDGVITGMDFVENYKGQGLCILATGSPVKEAEGLYPILQKPFTPETLSSGLEEAHACAHMLSQTTCEPEGILIHGKMLLQKTSQ